MIDMHSHVLFGIDDGPATIEGSVEIARAAVAAGTHTLLATPHVSSRYHNDSETIADVMRELTARLREEGVALEVRAGAEIAITHIPEMDRALLSGLGLGGGRWLLIEPPFAPVAVGLDTGVRELLSDGYRVLLAHPERCPAFHRDPAMLESLVLDDGILTSITAGSLVGSFGGEVRRFALRLMEAELVHNVASDAHDAVRRAPSIAAELQTAGLGELADWLARQVPAAILADEEIPPRPAHAKQARRRPWRRAGGR